MIEVDYKCSEYGCHIRKHSTISIENITEDAIWEWKGHICNVVSQLICKDLFV